MIWGYCLRRLDELGGQCLVSLEEFEAISRFFLDAGSSVKTEHVW